MTHPISSRAGLRSVAALWIAGPLWYVAAEAIAASAFPKYSYAHNYISDLGVPELGLLERRGLDSPLHGVWELVAVYTFMAWQFTAGNALRQIAGGRARVDQSTLSAP